MTAFGASAVTGLIFEWRSWPNVEITARRTWFETPNTGHYTILVSNRRRHPLIVKRYRVRQSLPPGLKEPPIARKHYPPGADPLGFIKLDERVPPFLPNMTEWPAARLEGSMEADSPFVDGLEVEIDMPHRWFGIAREKVVRKVPIRRD